MRDLPSGWGTSDNENPWAEKQTPSVPAPQERPVSDAATEPALPEEVPVNDAEPNPTHHETLPVGNAEPMPVRHEELPMQDAEPKPDPASAPYSAPPAFPVSAPPVSAGGKPKFLLPAACVLGVILLGGGGLLLGKHFSEQQGENSAVRTVLEHDTTAADTTTRPAANTTAAPADTTTAMRTENALFSALTEQTTASTAAASQSIVTSVSIVTVTEAPAHSVPQTQAPPPQTEAPVQTQAPAATQPAETMPVIEPKPVEVNYDPAEVPFMPDPNTTYETWGEGYSMGIYNAIVSHPNDRDYHTQVVDPVVGYAFDLVDVSGDNIPELFISSGTAHYADLWLYTFADGKVVLIDNLYGLYGVCSTINNCRNIYTYGGSQGFFSHIVYELTGTQWTEVVRLGDTTCAVTGDKSKIGYWISEAKVSEEMFQQCVQQYITDKTTPNDIAEVGRRFPMYAIFSEN